MNDIVAQDREGGMDRLREMVLDHLSVPRPRTTRHVQDLQDRMLPEFMDAARCAWLAASSPIPPHEETQPAGPGHPVYEYLRSKTETLPSEEIPMLNAALEELGAHGLLDDVANSRDVVLLPEMPVHPYERRLLRMVGHPDPGSVVTECLTHAAQEPSVLSSAPETIEKAARACGMAHGDIGLFVSQFQGAPAPQRAKVNRRKLFGGLAKLFSGLVLLAGNAAVIPTLAMEGTAALPLLSSLAGGVAAVGDGVGLLLEGKD
jgi:hypothetical protein